LAVNLGDTLALRTTHCLRAGRHSIARGLNVRQSTTRVFTSRG
jgi:isopenicillin N synthase-like dioxygenase